MVTIPGWVLERYEAFTCYNSPYVAHAEGRAIDLYPGTAVAPSPVAGTVRETVTVRAPPKPYAASDDHLIVIDTADASGPSYRSAAGEPTIARLLHVDPTVEPGDRVAVGDPLGPLVRAGFFAPWVDNHIHLGFRPREADARRASGSLSLELDIAVTPIPWAGRGRVVDTGKTFAILDAPGSGIEPPTGWVGLRTDEGAVLDGGLPHYADGGLLELVTGGDGVRPAVGDPVSLLGERVGTVRRRRVEWEPITVLVNGQPITGLSLFCANDGSIGAKLIWPSHPLAVGDEVTVSIEPEAPSSSGEA